MHVSVFVINSLWNCQESEERETKKYDFVIFFHFQIFWTFGNLDVDFSINLNKVEK